MLVNRLVNLIFFKIKSMRKYLYSKYLKSKYNDQIKLKNTNFGNNFTLDIFAKKFKLKIGHSRFKMYGTINIRDNAELIIGDGVFFNSHCTISCMNSIKIGDNTLFGSNVYIYDNDHNYRDPNSLIKNQGYSLLPIVIGENCWIGANVIILKGVTIGANSVIGAGVIVHNDIPENTLIFNKQNLNTRKIYQS